MAGPVSPLISSRGCPKAPGVLTWTSSLLFSASNTTAPARFGVLSCRQITSLAGCQSGSSRCRTPAPPPSRSIAIHWIAQVGHGQSAAAVLLVAVRFLEHKRVILPTPTAVPETPGMRWLNRFDEHLERVAGGSGQHPSSV